LFLRAIYSQVETIALYN